MYDVYLYYVGISFIFYVLYVIKLSLSLNLSEETHAQSQYILMYYFKKYLIYINMLPSIFFIFHLSSFTENRNYEIGDHVITDDIRVYRRKRLLQCLHNVKRNDQIRCLRWKFWSLISVRFSIRRKSRQLNLNLGINGREKHNCLC